MHTHQWSFMQWNDVEHLHDFRWDVMCISDGRDDNHKQTAMFGCVCGKTKVVEVKE